jgi:hypothetical protein
MLSGSCLSKTGCPMEIIEIETVEGHSHFCRNIVRNIHREVHGPVSDTGEPTDHPRGGLSECLELKHTSKVARNELWGFEGERERKGYPRKRKGRWTLHIAGMTAGESCPCPKPKRHTLTGKSHVGKKIWTMGDGSIRNVEDSIRQAEGFPERFPHVCLWKQQTAEIDDVPPRALWKLLFQFKFLSTCNHSLALFSSDVYLPEFQKLLPMPPDMRTDMCKSNEHALSEILTTTDHTLLALTCQNIAEPETICLWMALNGQDLPHHTVLKKLTLNFHTLHLCTFQREMLCNAQWVSL